MKLGVLCLLLTLSAPLAAQTRWTRAVDPFVGTGGHGHTFPGATVPFGMVQLSPDTRLTGWDGCSGYHYSDDVIYGFSHTHLSGTGISDYGDVLFMPTVGPVFLKATDEGKTERGYASRFSHRRETASPGYYAVRLDDENVFAELTTTKRAGLHRYTYPETSQANIILDLAHRDRVLDSSLRVVGDRRIEGHRRSEAWARDQRVYFVAEFSEPFTSFGVALDDGPITELREARGQNIRAFFRFRTRRGEAVAVRVGISAVDVEGARRNLAAELGHWDFERVRRAASAAWERELGKIEVTGGTAAQRKNFYTAMYHLMLAPNLFMDVDGRYRGRDAKTHTARGFDNYTVFSLWDTFRAAHPLFTIIDQRRTRDYLNTFLAQYEQGGRLPVWELAGNETDTMIGYHAVSVLADAAVKGVGGFDTEKALAAMKHSARLEHFGLAAYRRGGYIPLEDEPESVSKTLEYAYDDWCIAQVARLLKREDDYRDFITRAQFYKNLFDPETGFMRPRKNGGWLTPFDPAEVTFSFTEANAWQYSFFVPHDIAGLMRLHGGRERFADKLDALFQADSRLRGREQADITGLIGQYAHGNEPSHHMAYLYNYAGRPWQTQARVRQIVDEFYRPTPDGLIGNEDCGQMSAWYILSAAGFYPVTPGAPLYAIGSPVFPDLRIRLENGRTFRVRALNTGPRNVYIRSATLDGRPFTRSFLRHDEIMRGGELVFRMGPRPNRAWGNGDGDVPVSSIEDGPFVPVPTVNAAKSTFRDKLRVRLDSVSPRARIFYTLDGTEPGETATPYRGEFDLERSAVVKAVAVEDGGLRSMTAVARFRRVEHDWTIKLLSRYSEQYTAGGAEGLIDGVRGTAHFGSGAWQGYWGRDFEAVVDLGRVETVTKLGAGFLQNVGSWIFMPTRVEFALSTDGKNFLPVLMLDNEVPDTNRDAITRDFVRAVRATPARFVRVRATNYGKLPAWHPGAGGDAWVFVDEIIIE
jgi:predicted alpha-1,2-mannosidase